MNLSSIQTTIEAIGLRTKTENIPLITTKGKQYSWLFDLRRVFMQRQTLEEIAHAFWERNGSHEPFQLGGLETAAIPLLTALMLTAPKERGPVNGFIIRKDRKTTGLGNIIEGSVNDLPVILVDDSLNSGTSAEKARAAVSIAGHEVREMFVVIDFLSRAGMSWRRTHGIRVQSLFTLNDFDLSIDPTPTRPRQAYRQLWRTATPGGFAFHVVPKSAPLLVGDRIYRGCDAAKMQAFSAETGGLLWEYQATGAANSKKGIWSCPAFHEGRLYFGAYNGTIYCLDAESGAEIWTHPDGEWVGASPLIVPKHGLVYFGVEYVRPWAQGSIAAFDMNTGEKVWEHQVKKLQHGSPGYWERGDLVLWGSADHEMLALDARTGTIAWRFKTRRSVKYAPAVDEARGLTAFASFDKSIYILDVATGNKRGEWQTGEICYTTPLFAGNKLFCGSGDRHLYIIDLDTMELVKKIDLYARVYSSPRLIGNRVIVGTNGGRVVEIGVDTLDIEGVVQVPDAVTNAIAVSPDNRRIFVSTYMNHLYAFERLGTMDDDVYEPISDHDGIADDACASETIAYANFEKVSASIDIRQMRREVLSQPEMWRISTTRQDKIAAQRETESVFLRSAVPPRDASKRLEDVHESRPTPHAAKYPAIVDWAHAFARSQGKRIGRMLLAKLKPRGQVYRHVDGGEYYQPRDRYHLVLVSDAGSGMICGDEDVIMRQGELWWFDNKQPHEASNPSDSDRIHLIFDLEADV